MSTAEKPASKTPLMDAYNAKKAAGEYTSYTEHQVAWAEQRAVTEAEYKAKQEARKTAREIQAHKGGSVIPCGHDNVTSVPLTDDIKAAVTLYWTGTPKNPVKLIKRVIADSTSAVQACRTLYDIAPETAGLPWCKLVEKQWSIIHGTPAAPETNTKATPRASKSKQKAAKPVVLDGRPVMLLGGEEGADLRDRYQYFLNVLEESEPRDGKTLFVHGTDIVIAGNRKFKRLTQPLMMLELAKRIQFISETDNGKKKKAAGPPGDLALTLLAQGDVSPLPKVKRFVNTPFFAADGTLVQDPGYHAASEMLYTPTPGLVIPRVSEKPSAEEIEAAKTLLMDELLGDFPFVTKADKANAMAYNLNHYARVMIDGPCPLFAFESTTERTGKTLLLDVCTTHALGEHHKLIPAPEERKEWGKQIVATLREGAIVAAFDNANFTIDSGTFAGAITAWPMCSSRILGVSENAELPAPTAWAITGNNMKFSSEMAKRVVSIKQDAQMERPEERADFKHPRLSKWARENRAALVHACLTLIQSWVAAGQPEAPGIPRLGGFQDWVDTIGGILHHVGIEGFLQNRTEFLDKADQDGGQWRRFVTAWANTENHDETGVFEGSASAVLTAVCHTVKIDGDRGEWTLGEVEPPIDVDLTQNGVTRSIATKFGAALRKHEGKWYGDHRINSRTDGKTVTWYLTSR